MEDRMVSTRKFTQTDPPIRLALARMAGMMALGTPPRTLGSVPANSSATGDRHGRSAQDRGNYQLGGGTSAHRPHRRVQRSRRTDSGRRVFCCRGVLHHLCVDTVRRPAYETGALPTAPLGRSRRDRPATVEAS